MRGRFGKKVFSMNFAEGRTKLRFNPPQIKMASETKALKPTPGIRRNPRTWAGFKHTKKLAYGYGVPEKSGFP